MANTTFSGPVNSTNGFVGAVTGAVTGNVTGDVAGSITLTSTVTASLPAAADNTGALYVITDNGAGNDEFALVVSDGSAWVKVTTTALT
jgi:hypothetical protein